MVQPANPSLPIYSFSDKISVGEVPPEMTSVDNILTKYSLTRDTAAKYVDAITQMNQTETAEALDVSRDTINRYKNLFRDMNKQERALLIASLTQDKLLEQATEK